MIKLKSINVTNFKSLCNCDIQNFGLVNMFFGYNNSGKSNIFKFLKLLFDKKHTITPVEYDDSGISRRSKTDFLRSEKDFWEGEIYNEPSLFYKNNSDEPIKFSVELDVSNELLPEIPLLEENRFISPDNTTVKIEGRILYKDVTTSVIKLDTAYLNDIQFYILEDDIPYGFKDIDVPALNRKLAETILGIFNDLVIFIDTDRNFTKEVIREDIAGFDAKNFKNWLFDLNINSEKYESFNQLIAFLKSFDFSEGAKKELVGNINVFPFAGNTNIGFTRYADEVEIMLQNDEGRFPLRNFGTGIQQFFFILSSIFTSRSQIVIIEELELNLSPLYQLELLDFLVKLVGDKYSQLLFSSHNPILTQRAPKLIDIVHHVRISRGCSMVDSHDDHADYVDDHTGESYFSMAWSGKYAERASVVPKSTAGKGAAK